MSELAEPIAVPAAPAGATAGVKTEPTETPLEALASIATVIVVMLFVFGFIFQNFVSPSGSMENTLLVGDHVVVDRGTFAPSARWAPFVHHRAVQRGDIIVFLKPNAEKPDMVLVKRCIGIPGDHIRLSHGIVYLDGVAQTEPYVNMANGSDYEPARDDFPAYGAPPSSLTPEVWVQDEPNHVVNGELIVPPGKVFAMGDHRNMSLDGRYWGFVPQENILGRPIFVYWSFESPEADDEDPSVGERASSFFQTAIHFFDKTRWRRTFHITR